MKYKVGTVYAISAENTTGNHHVLKICLYTTIPIHNKIFIIFPNITIELQSRIKIKHDEIAVGIK